MEDLLDTICSGCIVKDTFRMNCEECVRQIKKNLSAKSSGGAYDTTEPDSSVQNVAS